MLAADGISFSYRKSAAELFGDLTYEFAPGMLTAVTGASGRGKSTLLYILGLMLRPTGGCVRLDGVDLSDLPDGDRAWVRATRFGFVLQDAALDPARPIVDSVAEPALYAGRRRSDARKRASELLDLVGVTARAGHRPGEISGGQAQRAAVARALVNDPTVILADEPTGNLDRETARVVLDLLRGTLTAERSVVIVTHDPCVIEYTDRQLDLGRRTSSTAADQTWSEGRCG